MHPKLAAACAAIPEPQTDDDELRIATARGLLHGYHARWINEEWAVEAVEREFAVPIVNPATHRRSLNFVHAGKFDGLIARNGDGYLLEHKTCSEDVSPGSPYWRRLAIDAQVSGYLLASWLLGRKLTGVLYDVIRKPEIRPKKLGLADTAAVRRTSQYCGRMLSPETFQRFLLDKEYRETPEMFEARLAQDTLERSDWYFGRQVITRLDRELLTYAQELWQTAQDVHRAMATEDRRRNAGACYLFHRPCEYLDLCAGHARPESGRFISLPTLHPELEELHHDGSRVLTHTRLSTFALCRRKHHYRYGLGISTADTSEALTFGSLFHEALAAWWQTESGDGSREAPEAHDRDRAHTPAA